jgi:hypothetical protein
VVAGPFLRETVCAAGSGVISTGVVHCTHAVVDTRSEFAVADALGQCSCVFECYQSSVEPTLPPRNAPEAEVRLGCKALVRDVDDGPIRGDGGDEVAGGLGALTCSKLLWADHFSLIKRVSDGG